MNQRLRVDALALKRVADSARANPILALWNWSCSWKQRSTARSISLLSI
jgi:hypothetical protein